MLTVACVYKPGNGFSEEYVTRLRDGVKEHCKANYEFVCLTNQRVPGVNCLPLERSNRGWWNKLELFRLQGPIVYFDLDTVIVDDITDICTYLHVFSALSNFKRGVFASGFMAWCGDHSYLNVDIDKQTDREYNGGETGKWDRHGDQGYISEHLQVEPEMTNDIFPGRFVSYKWQVRRQGKVPKGASVVCFHGRPRPHQINWRLPGV